MPRSLPSNALMLSMAATPPWAWWSFWSLSFAGLFLWAMFVVWTSIVTPGWWGIPAHTACIWLFLAMGVMVTASLSCTVWVLLLGAAGLLVRSRATKRASRLSGKNVWAHLRVGPVSAVSRAEQINALVREHSGVRGPLSEETDLYGDLKMLEPDLDELLVEFAERFRVDLSGFRWYFHTDEDGVSPGRLFFRAPQDRVARIPLRLALLYRAAELGKWPVDYPEHSLPARRWDVVLNQCLAAGFAVWLVWWLARRLF